jgi:hypothetical protein
MPAPLVLNAGETPDSVTTTQVLNTPACNVGDTLYIVYGTDAFDLATMPEATSDAGALTPVDVADIGTGSGHVKTYLVECTTPGVKAITYPAHSGCDIHGHWIRIGEPVAEDISNQNIVATDTTSAHVANGVDPAGTDRLLVCTWLVKNAGAFVGEPYVTSMTKRAETGAAPFSDMMTATEDLAVDTPTGTRTATWTQNARYAALTVALARTVPGGVVESELDMDSSAEGQKEAFGEVFAPLALFSSATGMNGGGAEVSEVLCSPWATVTDVPEAMRAKVAALTDPELQGYLTRASELLWMLSGRRWYGGGCEESATLRSHPPMPGQGTWPYHKSWPSCACWNFGTWLDGRLYPAPNWDGNHITSPIAVRLPRSPVTGIVSVEIDGDPFVGYHLLRTGWLERTDGQGWRMCDESTVITYTFGEPPPAGGRDSAVELGVEMALSALGSDDCRLPERTISVTRQGVSMTIMDPQEFLEKGYTGLPGVDLWLSAVNGGENRPQAAGVWSPDIPSTMRS